MLRGWLPTEGPEITDLIVDFDPQTLERLPVRKSAVLERFGALGDAFAQAVVRALPDVDGVLDPAAVDRLMVRTHCEMQRISEEFDHGRRVLELLAPVLAALRAGGVPPPYRVVDIGCGTGYAIRWLAHCRELPGDVELTGVDYNRALVEEARRLAGLEKLTCNFEVANAFRLDRPAAVLMSTGVLHHFRDDGLAAFLGQHAAGPARAFVHFDFQPTPVAVPGAWAFHVLRMTLPIAHHDGVLSAARAHPAATLLAAARPLSTRFRLGMFGRRIAGYLPRVFQTLVGLEPGLVPAFEEALGRRAARLEWA